MNKMFFCSLMVIAVTAFSGCSVIMAAKKEGTTIDKVQACRSRGQFLAAGAQVVSSERAPSGELIEVYQFQKERGSAARALMHGVLDVSTMGLWEVVGTPMEALTDEKGYFSLRVFYDSNEYATKVELL